MDRTATESEIQTRARAGDHAGAAAALVKGYGPEIVTYLAGVLRASDDDVREVFSIFCEDVCRGLPGFRFASAVRTWAYVVANRAALKHLRGVRQRAAYFNGPTDVEQIAAAVSSTTLQHMRTTNQQRLAEVRDQLDPEERTILILRVDRQLAWREVAQVMTEDELSDDALRKREQALRKKFETIKRRLREDLGV
jgi:RNA polymerase sigma-70 factor (ECF subfamily)